MAYDTLTLENSRTVARSLEDERIVELREVARACADLPRVREYIRWCVHHIRRLFGDLNPGLDRDVLDVEFGRLVHIQQFSGQVMPDDVTRVVEGGNLREGVTLLENFVINNSDVILRLLVLRMKGQKLPGYVDPGAIDHIARKVRRSAGLSATALGKLIEPLEPSPSVTQHRASLRDGFKDSPLSEACVMLEPGAAATSRMAGFPFRSSVARTARSEADMDDYRNYMRVEDVYPPLSEREKKFMRASEYRWSDSSARAPWQTGFVGFKLNPEHMFFRLAEATGNFQISSMSGNTDVVLQACRLFRNFDVKRGVLACVATMGNRADHSCFEILAAAIPFGLEYDVTTDAVARVREMVADEGGAADSTADSTIGSAAAGAEGLRPADVADPWVGGAPARRGSGVPRGRR